MLTTWFALVHTFFHVHKHKCMNRVVFWNCLSIAILPPIITYLHAARTMVTSVVSTSLWHPAEWERWLPSASESPVLTGFVMPQFLLIFLFHWVSLQSPLLSPPLLTHKWWKSWGSIRGSFHFSISAMLTYIWQKFHISYVQNWINFHQPAIHSKKHPSGWSQGQLKTKEELYYINHQ